MLLLWKPGRPLGSAACLSCQCRRTSGHDLYGERFENFQRILAQLKAKDVEREVQAVLDRHPRPFGGRRVQGTTLWAADMNLNLPEQFFFPLFAWNFFAIFSSPYLDGNFCIYVTRSTS